MKTSTRLKKSAVAVPVPGNRLDVTLAIAEIGRESRELARIEADMNDRLAAIKEEFEAAAEPHRRRIAALTEGVQVWCEAHRGELLKNDAKTAVFPSGEVQWRVRPPKVVVRGVDYVLDQLRRLDLYRFIRVKEEVNKEAILAEPAAVAGVKGLAIEQGEDFVIKPYEAELSGEAA